MGRLFGFCRTAWKRLCCLLVYDIIHFRLEKNRTESGNLVAGLVGMFLLLLSSVTNKLVTLSGVCRLLGICFSALAGQSWLVLFLFIYILRKPLIFKLSVNTHNGKKKVYFAIKSDCMLRKTLSFPLKLLNSLTFKLLTDDKLQQVSYVPQVHTMVKCSLCKIKTGFRFFNTFYEIF